MSTIKISKAIDELQNQCCVPNSEFQKPEYQARALGIEALKYVTRLRAFSIEAKQHRLPGEDEA